MALETIYDGDGSDVTFDITFDYLEKVDVSVFVQPSGGSYTLKTLDTHYNISGNVVTFTSGNTPPNNSKVKIRRSTLTAQPRHTYYAGSSITANSLNTNYKQILYALEEFKELNAATLTVDVTANSITEGHMADDSVGSDQYIDGSIDLEHMSANSVDSDQYVDGSIDAVHIANDQINSQHYAAGSIDLEHMSANSVDSDQYVDGSIDNVHLADDAVGIAELSASGTASSSTFLRGDNSWAAPASGVIQVVSTTKTDTWSTTSQSTFVDVTGMAVTITPTSTNSKILVMFNGNGSADTRYGAWRVTQKIGSGTASALPVGDAGDGSPDIRTRAAFSAQTNPSASDDGEVLQNFGMHWLVSPNTTTATTYQLVGCIAYGSSNNLYLNQTTLTSSNQPYDIRGCSTITVMEVEP